MQKLIITTCLFAIASALVGCSHAHVYSPPARIAPLESSKPVAEDRTTGGVSVRSEGEIFGLAAASATLKVRHGVTEHSEVGVDANFMTIDDSDAAADLDPTIWSARVGGKWAPELLGDHVALIYGVGGGTSDGGQHISPDVGLVVAYENPYVVPFASVDGFVSEPINAQPIDVSSEREGLGTNIMTAQRTWGATFAGGVKVPIEAGGSTISPMVGMTRSVLTDGEEDADTYGLNLGVDVTFE
ncbi:hypothetical protein FIV42_25345 [Persicimonas caeni]|uniref:Porin family protein n=1 Tax=Persicimonas caeni TaxID=2292766 RepID=A0A4Y6Q048_PERCE|nr:hypothetical protein [Persicimonas caeni]QDG53946.1 hypothetical protein FIV42_25345 [Persicimonas caeni]QED35167.1 hypothetical protein FRD00_25340 [Persicimonas caeni]